MTTGGAIRLLSKLKNGTWHVLVRPNMDATYSSVCVSITFLQRSAQARHKQLLAYSPRKDHSNVKHKLLLNGRD